MMEGQHQYPALVMLYASHILQGFRTLEQTPAPLFDDVKWVVENTKKNPQEEL